MKVTFSQGPSLPDPSQVFNSSLDGGTRRALDTFEGEAFNDAAFLDLVREAAAFNRG